MSDFPQDKPVLPPTDHGTEKPARNRRADQANKTAKGRRGRRKRRGVFTRKQWTVVLSLCAAVILGFSAYLVNIARVADIEQAIAEEKAAYERRVYRTTVKNRDLVTKYAQEYGLRPAYIAAIILNESSYDPQAVSSVGARGMMQLMPDTGKWIAGRIGIKADDYHDDLLFDPDVNIHMGAWYLNYLSGLYQGDPVLVACAYHAGHGNVDAWLQRYSQDGRTLTIEEIPKSDTRAYAKKVVDSYAIYLENYYQD